MKILSKVSLSFALAASLATSATAEDMGANEYGKVSAELKAVYFSSNFLGFDNDNKVTAIGGSVNYTSPTNSGLSFGATAQVATLLSDDIKNSVGPTNHSGFYVDGAALSEVYLNYSNKEHIVKIGRQYIMTPLVSSALDGKSSESIIKDSFQGIVYTNKSLEDTTLTIGYVDMYQAKAKGIDDDIGEFEDFGDGATTIHLTNKSFENLTLQGQYLSVSKGDKLVASDTTATYLQADYQYGKSTLSAQYLSSKVDAADKTGTLLGLRATGALGIGKLGYLVAYNSAGDDTDVYVGAGEGTTDTPFTAMPVHGGGVPTFLSAETLVGAIVIPTEKVTYIPYGGQSSNDKTPIGDVTAYGAMAIYPHSKELLVKGNFEHVSIEKVVTNKKDTDTYRVYVSYKF